MKKLYFPLALIALISGCSDNSEQPVVVSTPEKEVVVVEKEVVVTDDEGLKALADSLDLSEEKYSDLLNEKSKIDKKTELYYRKIHEQQSDIDSLMNLVNGLTVVNEILNDKHEEPALTKSEVAIQKMVYAMHDSWKQLPETKDENEVLKFFHPQFAVSRISIESDNSARLERYSHEDFKHFIQDEIIKKKGVAYEFGNVDFLDIEIRNEKYFNVAYKCIVRTYQNDRVFETSSLLVNITGKNDGGKWGIASYSWVGFNIKH